MRQRGRKGLSAVRARVLPSLACSRRLACGLVLVAAAVVGSANAAAADSGVSTAATRQAQDIAESMMSPFCPGLTLAACPSPGAAALQDELRLRLERGESEAAIVADVVERFGSRVTGVPATHGLAALAWVLPPIAGAGILLLVRLLGVRRSSPDEQGGGPSIDAAMSARVDDELLQLEH